jgi:hypothetical protein
VGVGAVMVLAAACIAPAIGCGGDDDETVSPASLQERLLPESELKELRLEVERTFEWDNPIDVVVEGLVLPEATPPSEAVELIDDAGFEAGAGQHLAGGGGSITVIQFDSADGAEEVRDWLHERDLEQPCFAACVVTPEEFAIEGIPGAEAVHHEPAQAPPPEAGPPFEAHKVVFTLGSFLYAGEAAGPPPDINAADFTAGAQAVYEHVKDLPTD